MPIGAIKTSAACPSGTPQTVLMWQKESVCAQTLPAVAASGLSARFTQPTTDVTNTAGALIWLDLREYNVTALRFLCRHGSDIASKSATARIWLVREAMTPEYPPDRFEYEVEPALDITIGTSATPPILAAADSPNGGAQTAYADSIAVTTAWIESLRYRLQGNVAGVKGTLEIDHRGARHMAIALNVGTMVGVRVGSFAF
jgi:hypothetical protein